MLEVIGVGYGRTGTLSLKQALEILGYGKCYHFSELLKRVQAKRWLNFGVSEPHNWKLLFEGYQSTTDWPAAAFYKELLKTYPNAKFILTHRNAEEWYRSTESTIFKLRNLLPEWLLGVRSIVQLTDQVIWDGTFSGRFKEKDHAISCYKQHIDNVCSAIPAEQLLVFDVREGWPPLCNFLNIPIPPSEAFPKSNDRIKLRRYIQILQVLKVLIIMVIAIGFFAVIGLTVSLVVT